MLRRRGCDRRAIDSCALTTLDSLECAMCVQEVFSFFSFLSSSTFFLRRTLFWLPHLPLAVPQSQCQIKVHWENTVVVCRLKYNWTNFTVYWALICKLLVYCGCCFDCKGLHVASKFFILSCVRVMKVWIACSDDTFCLNSIWPTYTEIFVFT